ncbi:MAG: hypothetical protein H6719_10290 [Sandaracinaceae bacterium]|nr:hypothetical protein [Sandaracinaceae bacterium]
MRSIVICAALLAAAGTARADAIGPGQRGLGYHFEVTNLAEHPDYAFILYPTSNSGFGYVMEEGLSLDRLMMGQRLGGPTHLVAMTRDALRRHDPTAPRHPHADDGRPVLVVREPPASAPVAEAVIHPPGLVAQDDPRWQITRRFRIARVTETALVLELVEEVTQMRDGTSRVRTGAGAERTIPAPDGWQDPVAAPRPFGALLRRPQVRQLTEAAPAQVAAPEPEAPAAAPPAAPRRASSGCGACAAAPSDRRGLGALALLLFVPLSRRGRSRRRA